MASSKEQNKAPRDRITYVDHYVGLNHDEMCQLEIFSCFFATEFLCIALAGKMT